MTVKFDNNITGPLSDVLTSCMSFEKHNGEGWVYNIGRWVGKFKLKWKIGSTVKPKYTLFLVTATCEKLPQTALQRQWWCIGGFSMVIPQPLNVSTDRPNVQPTKLPGLYSWGGIIIVCLV
jgi:hypothetical protein